MLQAIQVNYEQTLTALLERALSASLGRETEVVNAGMGGWNPNQYLIAARTELERSRYDLLLVFVYLENDIIGRRVTSFPPASGLFAPVLKPLEDPVGVTWDKSIALSRIMLRRHSHLFVYIDNLMVVIPARAGTREHLLTNTLRSRADSPTWQVTADILADISAAARTLHTPVLYVLLPPAHFIDQRTLGLTERMLGIDHADVDLSQPAHRMIAELSSRHLEVVDATPALKQAFDDLEGDLYGRVDKHFGLAGHRVIARFLEPVVREFLAGAHYVSPYWLDF